MTNVTNEAPQATLTSRAADAMLSGSAAIWFLMALLGQWAFLYYIIGFYGVSIAQGNFQAWTKNTSLFKGYVAGDTVGNLFFAAHISLAAVVTFGGALQLIPQIRSSAISFHRWNGRVFLLTAVAASLVGLWLIWVRGDSPTLSNSIAISLNAALIILFAALAWRAAVAREIPRHRRWALRTYIVANGVWFERVGFFAWLTATNGAAGESFFRVWAFACYLLPLAVLELYLRTKDDANPRRRLAMACALLVLTAIMSAGAFGLAAISWWPLLRAS